MTKEMKQDETKRYRDLLNCCVSLGGRSGTARVVLEKKGARVAQGCLMLAEDSDACTLFLGRSVEEVRSLPGATPIAFMLSGRVCKAIKVPLASLDLSNPATPQSKNVKTD